MTVGRIVHDTGVSYSLSRPTFGLLAMAALPSCPPDPRQMASLRGAEGPQFVKEGQSDFAQAAQIGWSCARPVAGLFPCGTCDPCVRKKAGVAKIRLKSECLEAAAVGGGYVTFVVTFSNDALRFAEGRVALENAALSGPALRRAVQDYVRVQRMEKARQRLVADFSRSACLTTAEAGRMLRVHYVAEHSEADRLHFHVLASAHDARAKPWLSQSRLKQHFGAWRVGLETGKARAALIKCVARGVPLNALALTVPPSRRAVSDRQIVRLRLHGMVRFEKGDRSFLNKFSGAERRRREASASASYLAKYLGKSGSRIYGSRCCGTFGLAEQVGDVSSPLGSAVFGWLSDSENPPFRFVTQQGVTLYLPHVRSLLLSSRSRVGLAELVCEERGVRARGRYGRGFVSAEISGAPRPIFFDRRDGPPSDAFKGYDLSDLTPRVCEAIQGALHRQSLHQWMDRLDRVEAAEARALRKNNRDANARREAAKQERMQNAEREIPATA